MAKGQGGIHLSIFIVAVVIAIGAIFFSISLNGTVNELRQDVTKANNNADSKENRIRELTTDYDALKKVVLGTSTETPNVEMLDAAVEQAGQDIKDVLGGSAAASPFGMDDALGEMTKVLQSLKSQLESQKATAISSSDASRLSQEQVTEIQNEYQARVTELRDEANELQSQLERARADARDEVSRLQSEIQDIEDDCSSRIYDVTRELQITQGLLDKANQRIQQLERELKKERRFDMMDPDGEILRVEEELGFAWINIGQQHRLSRGLVFQVFQLVGGGKRVMKGRVEVSRIEADFAEVRILETLDPYNPIAIGDQISSPFYNKDIVPIFVFAGERPVSNRLSQEEMVRKIEAFGGVVEEDVRLETTYVVALQGYSDTEEYDEARSLGVTILREDELLEFIE